MKKLPDIPNFSALKTAHDHELALRALIEYLIRLKNEIELTLPAS